MKVVPIRTRCLVHDRTFAVICPDCNAANLMAARILEAEKVLHCSWWKTK